MNTTKTAKKLRKNRKVETARRHAARSPSACCEVCKHMFPKSELYVGPDPFISELWRHRKDIPTVTLCRNCEREAVWDV